MMMAVSLATFTLGAMGWYAAAGVAFDNPLQDDVEESTSAAGNPQATGVGSENIGFFGVAVGVVKGIVTVVSLTYKTEYILRSVYDVPAPLAYSIQGMFDLVVGMTLYGLLRGVNIFR